MLGKSLREAESDPGLYPSTRRFQNVQAKESIATIQTQEVEAVVNMPGTIIARIPQLIPVGVSVRLDSAPNTPIQAAFREAAGTADPETQTYEVSFSFTPRRTVHATWNDRDRRNDIRL